MPHTSEPKRFYSPLFFGLKRWYFCSFICFQSVVSFIPGSKVGGSGGGDWLGLSGGDDDGGLDLSSAPLKTSTPFPQESRKDTPSVKGTL